MPEHKERKKYRAQVCREIQETIEQLKVTIFLMCWEEDPWVRRVQFNEAVTCLDRLVVMLKGEVAREQLNSRPVGQA